jgi:hypothetical protein
VAVAKIAVPSVQITLTADVPMSMPKNMPQLYVSANIDASGLIAFWNWHNSISRAR